MGYIELDFSYDNFYASVYRDGCYIHLKCAAPAPRDQTAFERAEHLEACAVISGVEFYVRDPDGYILGFIQPAT